MMSKTSEYTFKHTYISNVTTVAVIYFRKMSPENMRKT